MATQAEKILTLEMVGLMGLTTLEGLAGGQMPGPSQYVGVVIVYGMLSVAAWWPKAAGLAAGIGGLVIIGAMLKPTTNAQGKSIAGVDIVTTMGRLTSAIAKAPMSSSPGITGSASAPVATYVSPVDGKTYPVNEKPATIPGTNLPLVPMSPGTAPHGPAQGQSN